MILFFTRIPMNLILIVNQFDTQKQALKFIKKLSRKKIESRLILNRFIDDVEKGTTKTEKLFLKYSLKAKRISSRTKHSQYFKKVSF